MVGNIYTDGCQIPNVYDANGANARYQQLDAYAHFNDIPWGSPVFDVPLMFRQNPIFAGELYIPRDANSVLGIAKANNDSIFSVGTNTKLVSLVNGTALRLYSDEYNTTKTLLDGTNGRMSLSGEIVSTSTGPTVAASAAAGTGRSASVTGTNTTGLLTLTTGTGPTTGQVLSITWSSAKPASTYSLVLTAANSAAVTGLSRIYVDSAASTTTAASIVASTALAASTVYGFYYAVISY